MERREGRVATVGGAPISIGRLEQRVVEIRRGPRGRHLPPGDWQATRSFERWIVQDLIREAVLVHEARTAGIIEPSTTVVDGPSEATMLPQPAMAELIDHVVRGVTVPPDDIRAYYERNLDRYRRPASRGVRHVLLPDEASAVRMIGRLAAGEDMGRLAAEVSIDVGSRTLGGELAGPFEDAVFAARIGGVVGPIQTEHGWHVLRVEAESAPRTLPFIAVASEIEAELLDAARAAAFAAWLEERCAALVVMESGFEHPADPVHGVPSHRH